MIIVTGGVGGIGGAITEKFLSKGCRVAAIDIDDEAASKYEDRAGFKYFHADVTDIDAMARVAEKVGSVSHVVTLAGRALENEWKPFAELSAREIRNSLLLNLFGQLNAVHAFLPKMQSGSVTLISSINHYGRYGLPVYSAAKAGLVGFVNAVTREFGAVGIRVNTVSPGTVPTENTMKEPKDFSALLETTALNRFATREDVAELVYALAVEFTSVTGQEFIIDCGQTK